jgi:hypothetical protein
VSAPTFHTIADLRAWEQSQVDDFCRDAPFVRDQAGLMIAIAARIIRVRERHQHLIGG